MDNTDLPWIIPEDDYLTFLYNVEKKGIHELSIIFQRSYMNIFINLKKLKLIQSYF